PPPAPPPSSPCPARGPAARAIPRISSSSPAALPGVAPSSWSSPGSCYMLSSAMIPDRVRFVWLAVVVVLLWVGAAVAQQPVQSPLLLMISIDGLRPDHVTAADRQGSNIPNPPPLLHSGHL